MKTQNINKSIKRILTSAVCLVLTANSYAESKTVELEEYVSVSNRVEVPISQVTSSVTVLTAEDIAKKQSVTVYDALSGVPGVVLRRNGGPGATSSVSLRGTNDTQTLLLVDGVRMFNPASTSSVNFGFLPAANIERIEILRGSHSVVHGADAVGGVINVITKDANEETPMVTIGAMGGSYSTGSANIQVQGKKDNLSFTGFLESYQTDGFSNRAPHDSEADDFERVNFDGHIGYQVSDDLKLKGIYKYANTQSDFDNFGAPEGDGVFQDQEQHFFMGEAEFKLMDGEITSKPMISYTNIDTDIAAQSFFTEGTAVNLDWQNNYSPTDTIDLVGGLEYEDVEGKSTGSFNSSNDTKSAYILGTWSGIENLYIDLGARVDNNSDHGTEETWRVAGSYLIDQTDTRFHSSYGTSFKAPSISQLYNPSFGNTALKAETGESYEFGVQQDLYSGELELGATYFRNDIENQIAFDTSLSGIFGGRFNNIDQVETDGYETYVRAELHESLVLTVNYTYLDAEDAINKVDIARQPRHSISSNLSWDITDKLNVVLYGTYKGSRFDRSSETTPMGSYTVFDLSASYEVIDDLTVFGKVDNLTNKKYQDISGFSTPELSAYAGFRYSFW